MGGHEQLSGEDRRLLRESVRRLLESRWSSEGAVERATDASKLGDIWRALCDQGLGALGTEGGAGLRAAHVVVEELGRAACPAPLLGSVLANRLLGGEASHQARAFLEKVHVGEASVGFALGGYDGDRAAGEVAWVDGRLVGRAAFAEGALGASCFLVLLSDPGAVAIVEAGAAGLGVQFTPGLGINPLSELTFDCEAPLVFEVASRALTQAALVARLACAARALGAAQRAFDLAVEWAKLRRQFGRVIGEFQALQHKLADCLIRLDGSRLLIDSAADAHDRGDEAWPVFASAALAFAGPALRQGLLETHHALGAVGYAEEHEAPRHFRGAHVDLVRFGGAARARAELSDHLLGPIG